YDSNLGNSLPFAAANVFSMPIVVITDNENAIEIITPTLSSPVDNETIISVSLSNAGSAGHYDSLIQRNANSLARSVTKKDRGSKKGCRCGVNRIRSGKEILCCVGRRCPCSSKNAKCQQSCACPSKNCNNGKPKKELNVKKTRRRLTKASKKHVTSFEYLSNNLQEINTSNTGPTDKFQFYLIAVIYRLLIKRNNTKGKEKVDVNRVYDIYCKCIDAINKRRMANDSITKMNIKQVKRVVTNIDKNEFILYSKVCKRNS
ncbi:unnamed protein product, partial [Owenia fusiformis]